MKRLYRNLGNNSTDWRTLRETVRDAITERLAACYGNKTRAAASLGISMKTIYNWLSGQQKKHPGRSADHLD